MSAPVTAHGASNRAPSDSRRQTCEALTAATTHNYVAASGAAHGRGVTPNLCGKHERLAGDEWDGYARGEWRRPDDSYGDS
jgi:hypothetical protein